MAKPAPLPLSALLSRLLIAFARDYADADMALPSLEVLCNVLRVVEDAGIRYRDLPALSRISRRAARIALQHLQQARWLAVEPASSRAPRTVKLSSAGKKARDAGMARLESTEREWANRFGSARLGSLRQALSAVVQQLDLELPHYPTSYGPGDISMTGGRYVPADPGPPRVPAHGQEWPVVLRDDRSTVSELPLPALVSQTLTAFAIDYDEDAETQSGGLQGVVSFLRFVGDEGMPLSRASRLGDITGSGRSTLERHGLAVVEPGTGRKAQRLVTLTPRGKRARDRYPASAFDVEASWRGLFGTKLIGRLRRSLELLHDGLDDHLADFPETNQWLRGPRGSGTHRSREIARHEE